MPCKSSSICHPSPAHTIIGQGLAQSGSISATDLVFFLRLIAISRAVVQSMLVLANILKAFLVTNMKRLVSR